MGFEIDLVILAPGITKYSRMADVLSYTRTPATYHNMRNALLQSLGPVHEHSSWVCLACEVRIALHAGSYRNTISDIRLTRLSWTASDPFRISHILNDEKRHDSKLREDRISDSRSLLDDSGYLRHNRLLFRTLDRKLGLGLDAIKPGDRIFEFPQTGMTLILRPIYSVLPQEESEMVAATTQEHVVTYRLISDCYIDGYMDDQEEGMKLMIITAQERILII